MKATLFPSCRQVYGVCCCPDTTWSSALAAECTFQKQNVLIRNHPQSSLSAWDGSVFCNMNSALTHTNDTIYQALGMCQVLCLKLCMNHLLLSSHRPIFIPILQSGKQVFREINYHNEPRLGLSSFLHFFSFSNDFSSCFASNTPALLPNSMGQTIICTLVKKVRSNDMIYAKKKKTFCKMYRNDITGWRWL